MCFFFAKLYYIQQISGTVLQIIQNNSNQHKLKDKTEVFSSITRWYISLSLNIYSWNQASMYNIVKQN